MEPYGLSIKFVWFVTQSILISFNWLILRTITIPAPSNEKLFFLVVVNITYQHTVSVEFIETQKDKDHHHYRIIDSINRIISPKPLSAVLSLHLLVFNVLIFCRLSLCCFPFLFFLFLFLVLWPLLRCLTHFTFFLRKRKLLQFILC